MAQPRHHLPTAEKHQRSAEQKPPTPFVNSQGEAAERDQAEGGQAAEQGKVLALQTLGEWAPDLGLASMAQRQAS